MTARRTRCAVELASDIGAKAYDLYNTTDDKSAMEALREVEQVNPEIFAWLRRILIGSASRRWTMTRVMTSSVAAVVWPGASLRTGLIVKSRRG